MGKHVCYPQITISYMRIIIVESGCGDINRKVRLNETKDDIYYALN